MSVPAGMVRSSGAPEDGPVEVPEIPRAAYLAAVAADEKLGQETVLLAMGELFGVVDAFVVTSGSNVRQVRSLVEEIERRVKEDGGPSPASVEGLRDGSWVLMDYGDFVVHVFLDETRHFYDLEHLWSGAPRVRWQSDAD
ncbi:MAG TPA: ribosome silencing factor [Acidimicrobiales bacterium]|nr:ribosome silencing factor [Acidimicrobiales bacterium]